MLTSLQIMEIVRFSFKKDLVLPMSVEARISSSQEALQALAFRKPTSISPKNTQIANVNTSKPVIMYRGHVVQDASPVKVPEPIHSPSADVKINKPLRIYRGHVVHG